jgi:hemerythrin-like domain-containing protein
MSHASTSTLARPEGADTSDYVIIHRAIRSAGHALAEAARSVSIADRTRLQAFMKYWRGHTGEILSHHGIEDTIFFPALRQRSSQTAAVLDQLDHEHHRLDHLMEAAEVELGRVVAGAAPTGAVDALRRLADLMDDHLDLEDREIVPQFVELFSADEYEALTKAAIKQTGINKQAAFTVPYIGYWATPAERELLLGQAPVPFRVLYLATRRRHGKLAALALGSAGRQPIS